MFGHLIQMKTNQRKILYLEVKAMEKIRIIVVTVLLTVIYWALAAVIVILGAAAHGDCGLEEGSSVTRCLIEKRAVIVALTLIALTIYVKLFGYDSRRKD